MPFFVKWRVHPHNIDFTTLKKWVPDYENKGSSSLIVSDKTNFTSTIDGFITYRLGVYGNNTAYIDINNKRVAEFSTTSDYGFIDGMIPVSTGDEIELRCKTDTPVYAYYIPGKWV